MSSQYFPPYVVSKSNIKVFFNLSGYAKEDDLEYLKAKNNIEKKYLVFLVKNILTKQVVQKVSCHGNLWESLMKYLNL